MEIKDCWYRNVCSEQCQNSCIRYNSMVSLCQKSRLSENNWEPKKLYADDFDTEAFRKLAEIKREIVEFVKEGNSLYLYSKYSGNGKTSWSIKLLLAYFDNVWHRKAFNCAGVFVSVPSFIFQNKENINKPTNEFMKLKEDIVNSDLVVWDDIAATKMSEFDYQLIISYLDERKLTGKANIYTGNCGQEDCVNFLGQRLASRIWNDSIKIELVETDKRGEVYDD